MANQNFKVKKGLEVGTGTTVSVDGINVTGVVTATQFSGDGSGLTGVTASGTGVVVQEEGSNIGTAATINFIGSNVTAALSGGIANVTVSAGGLSNVVEDTTPQLGGNLDLNSKNITGTGNISITGGFNATGVSTFQENVVFQTAASFGDSDKINVGAGNDLQIFHDGTSNIIKDAVGAGISLVGNTKVVGVLTATSFSGSLATTDLTGTITNAQLAGSIADGKLASTFLKNVVEDTTPQLGGNLDLNGKDITGTGDINITGVSTFVGNVNLLSDSGKFIAGAGGDLEIFHDGNDSGIRNNTGGLYLQNDGTIFIGDVGANEYSAKFHDNGATELYYDGTKKFETTSAGVTVTGTLAATAVTGSGSGLTGLTGASAGTYGASNITPVITVDANGRITGIATVDTAGGGGGGGGISNLSEDTTPQLGGDLDLNGNDITGTGNITITSADAGSSAGPEFKLHRNSASPADADYLGQIKFAGESDTGVERNYAKITGKISDASNGTEDGIIEIAHIKAGSQNISARWTSSELKFLNGTNVSWADSLKAKFGDSDDLQVYHSGSESIILNAGTGQLNIRTDLLRVNNANDSETLATFFNNGAVSLYHNNALRLKTTDTGVNVTDNLRVAGISTFIGNVNLLSDSAKFIAGAGSDLEIYHNGNNFIDATDGNLYIRTTGGASVNRNMYIRSNNNLYIQSNGSGPGITLNAGGTTQIYHSGNGAKIIETSASGATVTGTLAATAVTGDGSGLTNLPASGITTANTNVQVTWSVTSSGSSAYRFTGPGNDASDDNPDLYLVRGQRYRFTNNSGGSHPFQIRSSPGGSAYSTGVTNNGGASGNIDFNVQHDAPERLYYQCTNHSGMVGNIYIVGGSDWRMTDVNTSTAPEIYTTRNVGIGTDNPDELLEVGDGTVSGALKVSGQSSSVTSNGLTVDWESSSNSTRIFSEPSSGGSSAIRLFTTNSGTRAERLRITNDGKFGFNTTNPGAYDSGANHLVLLGNTSGTGNAGITIASGTDSYGNIYFADGTSGADAYRGHIAYNHDGNTMRFATNGSERLRINSDGKIGINNTDPLYAMHFKNAMASSPSFIHMEATGSNVVGGGAGIAFDTSASNAESSNSKYLATIKGIRNSDDDGSNDLVFSTTEASYNGNLPTERMRIDSNGRVSIGQTVSLGDYNAFTNGLVVKRGGINEGITIDCSNQGGLFFSNGTGSGEFKGQLIYYHTSGDHSMRMLVDGSERMRIKHTGNIDYSGGTHSYENPSGTVIQVVQPGVAYKPLTVRGSAIVFGVGAGSAIERARITDDGITFNGDTAAANALDDYEEGTWDPTIVQGWTSITYTNQVGWYIKIGNMVTASGSIQFSGTSASNHIQLSIPFAPGGSSDTDARSMGAIYFSNASMTNNSQGLGQGIYAYPSYGTNVRAYLVGNAGTVNSTGNASNKWIEYQITFRVA